VFDLGEATGYGALRVEEIVLRAGVAKGTFFALFRDEDALMDHPIGTRIDAHLEAIASRPTPRDATEMVTGLIPTMAFMTCERYVFDVILRSSGAAAIEGVGTIAATFFRRNDILADWVRDAPFRRDLAPELVSEGIQALAVQAMAMMFCMVTGGLLKDRLETYLQAWPMPGAGAVNPLPIRPETP